MTSTKLPVRLHVTLRLVTSNSLRRPVRMTKPRIRRTRIAAWSPSLAGPQRTRSRSAQHQQDDEQRRHVRGLGVPAGTTEPVPPRSLRPKDSERIGPLHLRGYAPPPFPAVEDQGA